MLDGGEDPLFVARRLVRAAAEDVGLADPSALAVALAAKDAYHFLGTPEGELALAEAAVYLACAPKSNAVYTAFAAARADVQARPAEPVPLHIRNAPTRLMRDLGYGHGYQYAHDAPDAEVDAGPSAGRAARADLLSPGPARAGGRHPRAPRALAGAAGPWQGALVRKLRRRRRLRRALGRARGVARLRRLGARRPRSGPLRGRPDGDREGRALARRRRPPRGPSRTRSGVQLALPPSAARRRPPDGRPGPRWPRPAACRPGTAGRLDVVFPVLHGPYGEDGTMQGLLELADVPYVGAGVLASAVGMDKATMKAVFRAHGLPIVPHHWSSSATSGRSIPTPSPAASRRSSAIPCFVKPSNLGSSVGISKVRAAGDLAAAVADALGHDRQGPDRARRGRARDRGERPRQRPAGGVGPRRGAPRQGVVRLRGQVHGRDRQAA